MPEVGRVSRCRKPSHIGPAELFETRSGAWSSATSMGMASMFHTAIGFTATSLDDGSVPLAGDDDDQSEASTELYDPGAGS